MYNLLVVIGSTNCFYELFFDIANLDTLLNYWPKPAKGVECVIGIV